MFAEQNSKVPSVAPEPKDPVLQQALTAAAAAHGVPRELLRAVAYVESRYVTTARNPKSGALGWFQFMPQTAAGYGIDPLNPVQAADGAARYLRWAWQTFAQDWSLALAAYNWGPERVKGHPDPGTWPRGVIDYAYAVYAGAGWPVPFYGEVTMLPASRSRRA